MINENRGSNYKLIDILLGYLIKDGVYVISDSAALDYNALACAYCEAQHLVDYGSTFECQRCGHHSFKPVEV